jgi:hypothetical protein
MRLARLVLDGPSAYAYRSSVPKHSAMTQMLRIHDRLCEMILARNLVPGEQRTERCLGSASPVSAARSARPRCAWKPRLLYATMIASGK